MPRWKANGYSVHLVFLRLDSLELAIERVAVRVAQGGHNVSEEVIQRRFAQGWRNFSELYRPLVDSWQLYDNSSEVPRLLDAGFNR
jgi:predicted ABC-type ATPase